MALTEELPIYRATYRLLNLLIRATQDFPHFQHNIASAPPIPAIARAGAGAASH